MSGDEDILDESEVERAAGGLRLALPRSAARGRVGEVRANSVGSSMELHDFRQYQAGDDLRHLDWNAVARTGELILRVRQEEVAPRLELVLDGSASMRLSGAKAARARELALCLSRVGQRQGLEPSVTVTCARAARCGPSGAAATLRASTFDGKDGLDQALRRAPPLRRCGIRAVISDFLFETDFPRFAERTAREATQVAWIQLLDPEDLAPTGGFGARLVEAERDAELERMLSPSVLRAYQRRLEAHQALLRQAAARVRATFVTASAARSLSELVRGPLAPLFTAGQA